MFIIGTCLTIIRDRKENNKEKQSGMQNFYKQLYRLVAECILIKDVVLSRFIPCILEFLVPFFNHNSMMQTLEELPSELKKSSF